MSRRSSKPARKATTKIGRPTKFDPEYVEQAYKLALLGATDKQLADFWGVSEKTINTWKRTYPDFLQSLKAGKLQADATISEALFHRAKGYSHPAIKILVADGVVQQVPYTEHYPPDATSLIFWLKNRQPGMWRDKVEHTGEGGGPIVVEVVKFGDTP